MMSRPDEREALTLEGVAGRKRAREKLARNDIFCLSAPLRVPRVVAREPQGQAAEEPVRPCRLWTCSSPASSASIHALITRVSSCTAGAALRVVLRVWRHLPVHGHGRKDDGISGLHIPGQGLQRAVAESLVNVWERRLARALILFPRGKVERAVLTPRVGACNVVNLGAGRLRVEGNPHRRHLRTCSAGRVRCSPRAFLRRRCTWSEWCE